MERLTVTKLSQISGLCVKTIQKYADAGRLPHRRDKNNWRIFKLEAVEIVRGLAGISQHEGSAKSER